MSFRTYGEGRGDLENADAGESNDVPCNELPVTTLV